MKKTQLPFLRLISLATLGVLLSGVQLVIAAPASIFKPIINDIRSQLPKDMVMRLPAKVPSIDAREAKPYAVVRGYQSEYLGGSFGVDLAATPDCSVTACNIGNIFVTRKIPIDKNSGLYESQRNAKQFNLIPGIKGFYYNARSGSAGYRDHVFWKQNGLFFELEARGFSKQQVIDMAVSMAKESPIKSAKASTNSQSLVENRVNN